MSATRTHPARPTQRLQSARPEDIATAAGLLREGRLVAIPTETVYGLAANALNADAVASIFAAKGRPGWDPLIVHISDEAMLLRVVRLVPPEAQVLMDRFSPGPLTLLLPRHPDLPLTVTAGRELVGVRMPSHPVALQLIRDSGIPLAAPSANRFGHISPTTAQHVLTDLEGRIDAVLDGGSSAIGVESTVFDPVACVLYRQGGISRAEIEAALGTSINVYAPAETHAAPQSLPSPGVGIRHYAPAARVILVHSQDQLQQHLQQYKPATTAVLLPTDWHIHATAATVAPWADWDDTTALARTLYDALRSLDREGIETILAPLPAESPAPLVEAIRDRLQKAAREV